MAEVTIVGGGLAGMVAALRLAQQGFQVDLYESSGRLGGKAGANQNGADFDEHGYHIFPAWYLNVWSLVDELGIRANFVDRSDFKQINPHALGRYTSLQNITSARFAWKNLNSGVLSFPQMVLFFYAALDLVSQNYRYRAYLDQITINGFVRSRPYRTEEVAREFQDLMLKGISCPAYEVSAMTMRNVLRYWVRYPMPMYRILKGNLQQFWIQPIQDQLEKLGVTIHMRQALEQVQLSDGKVSQLVMRDLDAGKAYSIDIDRVIIAIPVEKLVALVDDKLFAAAPSLGRLTHLRAQAMAALNIYFKRKFPDLPQDHINLINSDYGLSFLDVSQTWTGYENTVLNTIASDFLPLEKLSPEKAISEMFADLQRYYPDMLWEDVEKTDFQRHTAEPLFMNDSGAWAFRPDALDPTDPLRRELPNLYLAGDYCRTHVDLVCMEGATTAGLRAAESLRADSGKGSPIPILIAETPLEWLLTLGKWVMLPVALVAKVVVLLQGRAKAKNSAVPPHA